MAASIAEVAEIMRMAADAEIMPRYRALSQADVREKSGPKDLVTIADIEAERYLDRRLRDLLPGSLVIGEEAAEEDPDIFRHLHQSAPVWIIDPVDGTTNFAEGTRYFCVMVALVVGGETVMGVILDPCGACWVGAEKGAGAWRQAYDGGAPERLSVLAPTSPAEMRGALNFRYLGPLREAARARVLGPEAGAGAGTAPEASPQVLGAHYRLGCAGHEYMRTVTGEAHFTLHGRTKPWDHLPGCLIHREAGGWHARFDGTPYRVHQIEGGVITAPDETSWHALRNSILGDLTPR